MATNIISLLASKFYSTASNARRAARGLGLEQPAITYVDGEGWKVQIQTVCNPDTMGGADVPDMVLPAAPALVRGTTKTVIGHKEFAFYGKSKIEKPIEFVRAFLNANPHLSRKDAMHELVKAGVSYATARTQYQRWFQNRVQG